MVPFLVWTALYAPFCLGVTAVCIRRAVLLTSADLGHELVPRLVGSVVMCLLAPAVYAVFAVVVAAGRRQMKQRVEMADSKT